jgi:hypothetical protein
MGEGLKWIIAAGRYWQKRRKNTKGTLSEMGKIVGRNGQIQIYKEMKPIPSKFRCFIRTDIV